MRGLGVSGPGFEAIFQIIGKFWNRKWEIFIAQKISIGRAPGELRDFKGFSKRRKIVTLE